MQVPERQQGEWRRSTGFLPYEQVTKVRWVNEAQQTT
jgi:hypothetical protein